MTTRRNIKERVNLAAEGTGGAGRRQKTQPDGNMMTATHKKANKNSESKMATEIPFWVGGLQKWVTGINKRTTCEDIVRALLRSEGKSSSSVDDFQNYAVVEKWRKMERPLDAKARILKVWRTWGEEVNNVKFHLKKLHPTTPKEVKSLRRKHTSSANRTWRQNQRAHALHPRRLLEEDARITETMERLMKVIVAQGETIQAQLKRLQEKEDQIDFFEQKMHLMRMEELGANYLLDAYLNGVGETTKQLEAESQRPQVATTTTTTTTPQEPESTMSAQDMRACVRLYEKILEVYQRLEIEEERLLRVTAALNREDEAEKERIRESEKSSTELPATPESVQQELELTRAELERITAINAALALEISQNDRLLLETSSLLGDKQQYVGRLAADIHTLDVETQRLQEEYDALLLVTMTASPTTTPPSAPASDDSGYQGSTGGSHDKEAADTDSNSDTGLSSLHSSSDESGYVLDTLV